MEVTVQLYAPLSTPVYASKQYDFLVATTDISLYQVSLKSTSLLKISIMDLKHTAGTENSEGHVLQK